MCQLMTCGSVSSRRFSRLFERFIPLKMTKTKYSLPWIDSSTKRLIRKRDKLYFRARKASSPDIKNSEHMFKRALEVHIGSMLPISSPLKMIILIPIVPEKMKRRKSFGHLSSPLKKTRLGSIPLEKTVS